MNTHVHRSPTGAHTLIVLSRVVCISQQGKTLEVSLLGAPRLSLEYTDDDSANRAFERLDKYLGATNE